MASRSTTTASTDLAEALTVAVTVIRAADGTLLYANPQFGTLLGASTIAVGEAIDTVLGASGAHVALTTAADEKAGEVELHGRCPDGRPIWLLSSARQISFGDEPRALLVAFRDASLRRQLEGEMARLAEFPEMNPGPACRLDPEGTVVLANAAASRLFEDEALVGSRWHDLVTEIDDVVWASVLASMEPFALESEVGDVVVLFTYVSRNSGETVFVFGVDITARRRAELRAEEQAAQLAEVARFPDMNPGPVLRLDLDATVLLANAAARDILGVDVVGQSWRNLCPGLEETTWSAALESPVPIPLEAHVGDRDYVFQHRRDLETELVFVFGTDVTHQKQAERALRQTEKMATLGTLVAGVAHELNNPAAATRRAADQLHEQLARLEQTRFDLEEVELTTEGSETLRSLEQRARDAAEHPGDLDPLDRSDNEAELEERLAGLGIEDAYDLTPSLVAQGVDDAVLARLANTIDESAIPAALAWLAAVFPVHALVYEIGEGSSRISEIVAALRSYSYLGQAPIQEIDVHEGLDSTLVILRSKLKAGVTVQREYCTDMPRFPAYGSELNQVWTNLIDNAADAMGGHGEIVIRTRQDNGWAVVEIEDHGPGIPEDIQSQVFDPFFTTKEPGKGTGLGLSTSFAIVTEKHGGTMSVESRPGHTCFTVRLPTAQPPL